MYQTIATKEIAFAYALSQFKGLTHVKRALRETQKTSGGMYLMNTMPLDRPITQSAKKDALTKRWHKDLAHRVEICANHIMGKIGRPAKHGCFVERVA